MVSASKILTVSYGTFSCTLEGFDDSFDTMKAIAEYFRDLAADDRYFGAEPPTPDADMLARIAEREISRRVQASEEQGKIVLRADQAMPEEVSKPSPKAQDAGQHSAPALAAFLDNEDEDLPVKVAEQDSAEISEKEIESKPYELAEDTVDIPVPPENDEPIASADHVASQTSEVEDDGQTARVEDEGQTAQVEDNRETVEDMVEPDLTAAELTAPESEEERPAEDFSATLTETAEEPQHANEAPVAEHSEILEDHAEDALEPTESLESDRDETQAPVPADAETEAEDVASKLRRIRSVVEQKDLNYEVSEYSEDEHAQGMLGDASAELDELLAAAREEDELSSDDLTEADQPEDAFDMDAFMATANETKGDEALARAFETENETAAPQDQAQDTKQDQSGPDSLEEDTLAQLLADAMPASDTEEVSETPDHPEPESDYDLDPSEAAISEPDTTEEPEPETDAIGQALVLGDESRVPTETEQAVEPIRARVVKMKRSDFEAALKSGEIEADEDAENIAAAPQDTALENHENESDLTPEEEAELQRELAEVEAEMGLDDPLEPEQSAPEPETIEDPVEAADSPAAEHASQEAVETENPQVEADAEDETSRRGLSRLIGGVKRQPEDVERIFHEADSQMGDQENSMRRNAIQHLRAAVAATRAEKRAGGKVDETVDETPYRSDLAEVVRPRRPSADSAGTSSMTSRPNDQRPAPLKLVAEQRVDRERSPVRPRRVAASDIVPSVNTDKNAAGFSDFAAELGATDLADLLEAAAAYMSDVEGQQEFSRPMLMSKLREAAQEDFSREDGLRSFGQLLREGKLRKLKGGRFAVTDETEFRQGARNVG